MLLKKANHCLIEQSSTKAAHGCHCIKCESVKEHKPLTKLTTFGDWILIDLICCLNALKNVSILVSVKFS